MLTIFYDGGCALCHFWVRFLVDRDVTGTKFMFAPLHGGRFQRIFPAEQIRSFPDSVIVLDEAGAAHTKSKAIALILERLGGGWIFLSRVLRSTPHALANAGYDLVARTRVRIFGKTKTSCPFMDAETQKRFDLS